jgi:hypothetical protein
VRLLHIALAAALAGVPAGAVAGADDPCLAAAEGTACADDHDPCTVDRCVGGACVHSDVPSRPTCEPLVDAYLRTLGLGDLVADLRAQLETMPDSARMLLEDPLDAVAADLVAASDALAGRVEIPAPGAGQTLAQARARVAFEIARQSPPRVRVVLKALANTAVRAAIGPTSVDLARRVRFLYRSTNQFKRELRRLQRVSGAFAR